VIPQYLHYYSLRRYLWGNKKPQCERQTTQWTKDKSTNNYLQNTTQKTQTRTPQKPMVNSAVPEW
jgi:hypothetical protein